MNKILQTLRDKADQYKPRPFLTLNDRIEEEKLRKLIRTMAEHGIGGFYAHARSGLIATYLSEEWFRIIDICADECERCGLQLWIYDEMGWPSGTAGGQVTAKDKKYSSRWLELADSPQGVRGRLIACYDASYHPCGEENAAYFLFEAENVGYIDVLNEGAVRTFIECTYEKYRERYGSRVTGFFTDEPQYGMLHTPYTPAIEALLEKGGDCIRDYGISLFFDTGDYRRIRRLYYGAAARLFLRNYIGQISRFCGQYGYKFTGHILEEKSLERQILSCGDVLSVYSLMQDPGMDWLGRDIGENALAPRQVSSVCKQFGKKDNVSESYACVGYGASLQELKTIADWEISNGITNLCYVLPYSVRGRRKRDYPSGIVSFQPYFAIADDFNLWLSRFCALSAESENTAEVLLVSPLAQAEEVFRVGAENAYSAMLDAAAESLERLHVSYHVTNAAILREHARAEGDKLIVGNCRYSLVLCFSGEESDALSSFRAQGGKVLVADRERWQETAAQYRDCNLQSAKADSVRTARFCVGGEEAVSVQNVSRERVRFFLSDREGRPGHRLDLLSLQTSFSREYELGAGECAMFVFGQKSRENRSVRLSISEEGWDCSLSDRNVLLLDRVDCYKDGKLYAEGIAPVLLQEKLVRDGENCRLKLVYRAHSSVPLCGACLGVENAERYTVSVNGIPIPTDGALRPFIADSILRLPLPDLPAGEIEIVLELDFSIPAEVRRVLLGEGAIESDFNRLQDLPEVENIYLIGEFSVRGQQEEGELLVCGGSFTLERFETPRNISCFGKSGLPFYAGEIVARKKVSVRKEGGSIVFGCSLRGAAVRVFVNGKAAGDVLWDRPLEIAELLRDGENEIELHIYNDLRNLFGPDHNKFKEPHMVGFTTFTDSPGWCDPQEPLWTDVYYLKEFGVRFPKGSEKE